MERCGLASLRLNSNLIPHDLMSLEYVQNFVYHYLPPPAHVGVIRLCDQDSELFCASAHASKWWEIKARTPLSGVGSGSLDDHKGTFPCMIAQAITTQKCTRVICLDCSTTCQSMDVLAICVARNMNCHKVHKVTPFFMKHICL